MTDLATLTVPLAGLRSVDLGEWSRDERHRLDVVMERTVLPLLVVPRTGATSVVVLSNGAVDHAIARGRPVFQRSTWSQEIDHHQIYVCDPGTLGDDRLSLAWGQVSRDYWAVRDAGGVIRTVAAALGADSPDRRVYYGSSAGGFLSLALLADDPGASAVVNNAQFDWTRWMATGLNPLRAARFDNMLPLHLRARHPLRTNVLNLLVKRDTPVRIDYHVNLSSKHDREVDRLMFEEFAVQHRTLAAEARLLAYEDPAAQHNPLPKQRTLHLLNTSARST